jgi:DNA-binding transcriptional LysR family regulator
MNVSAGTRSENVSVNLDSVALFAKVAEVKSFSAAARRLSMPLATVSRRVADLEDELGVRLLERSTRSLRLTPVGSEILEQAHLTASIRDAITGIVSDHRSVVSGTLRLFAPPAIESLIPPLVCAFQSSYPQVRVHVRMSADMGDPLQNDVDLAFHLGPLKDSPLVARTILTYRHRLVASPAYLAKHQPPSRPRDLLAHPLMTYSTAPRESVWSFVNPETEEEEALTFLPRLSMNDFSSLTPVLLAGFGIGDLPPLVQPQLLKTGDLVELMPSWRFRAVDLSLLHPGGRHIPRTVRLFKEFAAQFAPTVLWTLQTSCVNAAS